jgi:cellulose synthase/poly-beta-1,6-N-acetylglucosamine synthase-like glycosyltransferase
MHLFKQNKQNTSRKRQWGTEKRTTPLSMVHNQPSTLKLTLSRVAIILTIFFWVLYIFSTIIRQLIDGPQSYGFTMEAFSYSFVVSLLIFSSLMYLLARHGALKRFSTHTRVPRAILDRFFATHKPGITVLIPSYDEEVSVIRKTLISAALQEYPNLRIVLLVDDNPNPTKPSAQECLEKTRQLGTDISALLEKPYKRFHQAAHTFDTTHKNNKKVTTKDIHELASQYEWAVNWLQTMVEKETIDDHVDVFFKDQIVQGLASDLQLIKEALNMSVEDNAQLSKERIHQLYLRLVWIFKAEFEVFERKQYASLSHEANKAMNLNAYIGLMGGSYTKEQTPHGYVLFPTTNKQANMRVPDSEFIITLDADSLLLREYCLRLVYFLQQPGNESVAVTQTPYSSFRGAYSRIERLAGATTDIQHILHQGMTYYGATFWVGANAVIRKKALEDIVETEIINNIQVKRFIQDRTVIEDTESSIDLGSHGWTLVNYPERLSYSATPPDFGSLIVQRRRWANGGLLILPKLFSQIRSKKHHHQIISRNEILLRVNYMASIAWATFGLIFLLAYPYDGRLLSPLVLLAALPYFIAMASDLKYNGYHYHDVFSIYGFNLIMLPVNLAGVLKSIEQALSGKKIPFARTPKVKERTRTSILFLIVPLFIVGFSLFTVWRNIELANYTNASFAAFNAIVASLAIISYIGIRNLVTDIWYGLTQWMYVEDKPKNKKKSVEHAHSVDWRVVLYHGETKGMIPHQSLYEKQTV